MILIEWSSALSCPVLVCCRFSSCVFPSQVNGNSDVAFLCWNMRMTLESRLFCSSHHFLPHVQLFCFCMSVSTQGRKLPAISSSLQQPLNLSFHPKHKPLSLWGVSFFFFFFILFLRTDCIQMTLNWSVEKRIIQKKLKSHGPILATVSLGYYFQQKHKLTVSGYVFLLSQGYFHICSEAPVWFLAVQASWAAAGV